MRRLDEHFIGGALRVRGVKAMPTARKIYRLWACEGQNVCPPR
jgi:hypothetical protein